ncbi:hypothetical protein IW140_001156 [Coemansia sp. RSA 1813]|nr:hypothetical protein LPJ74_000925 [Coemansia sp. RSA 1843]KAJ2216601.1 hypothetical protein EV179_001140 [Coemansia sp. RSA 487]KAJ2572116.1 hypothetical protein IW140_001156 [Coemansia sp. RSA 1813]
MAETRYDILIWGATSFTGERLVEYLAINAPAEATVAIGGRSRAKLEDLKTRLAAKHSQTTVSISNMDIVVGDSMDQEQMNLIAAKARVIASTVGPYSVYGTNLVRACVEQKTDYCDITGEVPWARQMNKELNAKAEQNNVHIASLCGFDCIPADLGCMMLAEYAKRELGKPLLHVKGSIVGIRGGVSGGTLATAVTQMSGMVKLAMKGMFKRSSADSSSGDSNRVLTKRFSRNMIHYDKTLRRWQTFWAMSDINRMTACWAGRVLDYGPGFTYAESMSTKGLIHAVIIAVGFMYGAIFLGFGFIRNILYATRAIPRSGEGPSEEFTKSGFFSLHLEAFTESDVFYGKVSGNSDPGYGETIKYLGESALCLAFDTDDSFRPGVYPPSVIMGDALLRRLRDKGCQFEIGKAPVSARKAVDVEKKDN